MNITIRQKKRVSVTRRKTYLAKHASNPFVNCWWDVKALGFVRRFVGKRSVEHLLGESSDVEIMEDVFLGVMLSHGGEELILVSASVQALSPRLAFWRSSLGELGDNDIRRGEVK